MTEIAKKYRFLLIQAFHLPPTSKHLHRAVEGPKESCLMNYEENAALLADVEQAVAAAGAALAVVAAAIVVDVVPVVALFA